MLWGFPGGSAGKESACKAGNLTEALEKVLAWDEEGKRARRLAKGQQGGGDQTVVRPVTGDKAARSR